MVDLSDLNLERKDVHVPNKKPYMDLIRISIIDEKEEP
jgi:hypothetical protein